MKRYLPLILIAICIVTNFVEAQTTEFTYQGKLTDGSIAATGDYNFEFRLFSVNTGGTVISTIQRLGVPVSSGVFTVKLDFGANFDGQPRWLEIAIKPAGDPGGFQQLLPRQPVTSAPYSIRSLNASTADTATNATTATNAVQLGGVAASQYVLTGDARLSDARPPTAGSGSYIQNRTSEQASTNFNISNNGTAGGTLSGNTVNAATQFNIGGNRVFSVAGTNNVFAGVNAGVSNTGSENAFVGRGAGFSNTGGTNNSFIGYQAGNANANGSFNSFFGSAAGQSTSPGANGNSFFGSGSGQNVAGSVNAFFGSNTGPSSSGDANSFFGSSAGFTNTSGVLNSFVGAGAGYSNTTGNRNTFVGASDSGGTNTTGDNNTTLGANANVGAVNLSYATAIGAGAVVSTSNTIVLGRADASDSVVVPGKLQIDTLGSAGNTAICLNASNRIGACSSSLRYKTNLAPYRNGLNILNRLRPITFDWKEGGMHDLGFGAEDVEKIDPLLITYNSQGQVEGVKYDRIGVVLVNAVKEQQQIIENQQKQIDTLKAILCRSNPDETICR